MKKTPIFTCSRTLLLMLMLAMLAISCKKDNIINEDPDFKLAFSSDTVIFDTVFTSLGSVTQNVRIYNTSSRTVRISSIRLAGGPASRYRINIDGQPVLSAEDVDINANDSLYIFVRVNIDPTDASSPFVVTDSILFETNGNLQDVDLVAWGQNAHYILADTYIPGLPKFHIVAGEFEDVTWTPDKPYVVYGYAVVDSNGVLRMDPGVNVHFHDRSGLWIYKGGSLKVNGTLENPVTFQGDRLEEFYEDLPGQWDRIWINEGAVNNEINYAIIRNGFIGIQAETLQEQMGNQLVISNTVIENMSGIGLFTRFYNITGANLQVTNCGDYCVALTWGGLYDFRQCTFANYWPYSVRPTELLAMTNYFEDDDGNVTLFEMDAYFGNCIIYGRNEEELLYVFNDGSPASYRFDHSLLKTTFDITDEQHYTNCWKNEDPMFVDSREGDYSLDSLSFAVDRGNTEVINTSVIDIDKDLLQNSRLPDPDLGALEFQPARR